MKLCIPVSATITNNFFFLPSMEEKTENKEKKTSNASESKLLQRLRPVGLKENKL